MDNYTDFGIKARIIMLQKNITMTEIAGHLKISLAYVSYILKGKKGNPEIRQKIMEFLEKYGGDTSAINTKTS